MQDLEIRLRDLAVDVPDGAPPVELYRRATRARRRRRAVSGAIGVLCIVTVLVVAIVAVNRDDTPTEIRVGPNPTEEELPPRRIISLHDAVANAAVHVSPQTGLTDGQLVDVEIEGLEELKEAFARQRTTVESVPETNVLQCAGDVTQETAIKLCDSHAVQVPDASRPLGAPLAARDSQTVSVSRTIAIYREPPRAEPYDCATEPAGCVLAIAAQGRYLPPVVAPIEFVDAPIPVATLAVEPNEDLASGQEVTLRAEGLRPYGAYVVRVCAGEPQPTAMSIAENCKTVHAASEGPDPEIRTVQADAEGRLITPVTVTPAMYGFGGRTDCTQTQCVVVLTSGPGGVVVEAPFGFAADVVAPVPEMWLEPSGLYEPGQVVTLHGRGFPGGMSLVAWTIMLCPAQLEPLAGWQCSNSQLGDGGAAQVGDDGSFTTTITITGNDACRTPGGCVLSWVIPNGPAIISIPIPFADP